MNFFLLLVIFLTQTALAAPAQLLWPINCVPGVDCKSKLGFADPEKVNRTHNCKLPGYMGHEGTDILLNPGRMEQGVDVYAAAAGKVLWVFDGKFDRCPSAQESDCAEPKAASTAGSREGVNVCTPLGPFCKDGKGSCFWCFAGGNVVVIRHEGLDGVFATRYDHLKRGSIQVKEGDTVKAGQVIAQAGSAGRSSEPHLHFEVWGRTFYDPVDPWPGICNARVKTSLWKFADKPWKSLGR